MTAQARQVVTELFPLDDYSVDIQITITDDGTRYKATINADGQPKLQEVDLDVTIKDLAATNKELQKTMESVARKVGKTLTESDALFQLAKAGYDAFMKIFEATEARSAIYEVLDLSERGSIQITSGDFFLPWELMYPLDPDEDLSPNYFWGMHYIISRVIPGAYEGPRLRPFIPNQPNFGLLTDEGLSCVEKREIPFFERLQEDGKIRLISLGKLDPADEMGGFDQFRKFWNEPLQDEHSRDEYLHLAHFACHACYEEPPDNSYMQLATGFRITLRNMRNKLVGKRKVGENTESHPLVIMNACETGSMNPEYAANFIKAFLRYGARGVIATECAIPDAFAADFAEQLYSVLLTGRPLGESLLATRRYFWKKQENLLGLLYSLYASPKIYVTQL